MALDCATILVHMNVNIPKMASTYVWTFFMYNSYLRACTSIGLSHVVCNNTNYFCRLRCLSMSDNLD